MDYTNTDASTKAAFLVSSVYAVVGALWILYSDALVQQRVQRGFVERGNSGHAALDGCRTR